MSVPNDLLVQLEISMLGANAQDTTPAGIAEESAAVQALLEHGKLRTDQINSVVAALQGSEATALGDAIVTCLGNLVQSRYVQRARGCDAEKPQRPLPATVKVWTLSSRGPCT